MNNYAKLLMVSGLAYGLVACTQTSSPSTYPQTLETGGALTPAQQHLQLEQADLFFDIDPEQQSLVGKATLTLSVTEPQSEFEINLDNNYRVEQLWINDAKTENYQHQQGIIRFSLAKPLIAEATLKVTIAYQGKPHVAINAPWDGGFVWQQTESGKPWIATAVQGEGCDLIWPCIDHPQFEAQQTDIVIRVPRGLTAVSNGRLIDQQKTEQWAQFHWRSEQPQNNYGIALNIGPYEKLEATYQSQYGHQFPMVFYYLEGKQEEAQALFAEFDDQLEFYERVIGPYPFYEEKMGVVETPHLGMEHQTINAYGQQYKPGKFGFDWLLHHELAHEWFGNQMTNTDWDHMWLHEGFGSYMQPLFAQYLYGDIAYHTKMMESRIGIQNKHPLVSNQPMSEDDVYKADRGPGGDIYQKGAWILHTLRYLIGDDDFFAATRQLVYQTTDPKPGNFVPHFADTEEFIAAVNQVTGEDYQWFFEHYLYQAKLPELITQRDGRELTLFWKTYADAPFNMPIELQVDGRTHTVMVGKHAKTFQLNHSDDHVVIDPQRKVLRQWDVVDAFASSRQP